MGSASLSFRIQLRSGIRLFSSFEFTDSRIDNYSQAPDKGTTRNNYCVSTNRPHRMALDAGTLCGIDSVPIYLAISGCEVAYGFNKVADVVPDNISGILDDAWPCQ